MKLIRKIQGATSGSVEPGSTVIYKLTLDELVDILKKNHDNIITIWQLQTDGFDAIDMDANMWASRVIDDVLYLVRTDGHDIVVNGQTVDPEDLMEQVEEGVFSLNDIQPYFAEPDEKYIRVAVDPYAMKTPDYDQAAFELLGLYSFLDIVEAAEEYYGFRD